ncbi:hypothetical protein LINPERHAP2_LOCUS12207, partial [Linum perenne]
AAERQARRSGGRTVRRARGAAGAAERRARGAAGAAGAAEFLPFAPEKNKKIRNERNPKVTSKTKTINKVFVDFSLDHDYWEVTTRIKHKAFG